MVGYLVLALYLSIIPAFLWVMYRADKASNAKLRDLNKRIALANAQQERLALIDCLDRAMQRSDMSMAIMHARSLAKLDPDLWHNVFLAVRGARAAYLSVSEDDERDMLKRLAAAYFEHNGISAWREGLQEPNPDYLKGIELS